MRKRTAIYIPVVALAMISVAGTVLLWPHVDPSLPTYDVEVIGCPLLPETVAATVHGDSWAVPHVWLEVEGRTATPRWPHGYTARFNPQLEVVSGSGQVVAREGSRLTVVPYPGDWRYGSTLNVCILGLPS